MTQQRFDRRATARTFSLLGLEAHPVRVDVDAARGVAQFHLLGLPEASARESRVRVRAALQHVGVELDELVLTVHVCPATKHASFDLAIALGILAAIGRLPAGALDGTVLLGELSLSGEIQRVRGVLPIVQQAQAQGMRRAIVPLANAAEAAHVAGVDVRAARHVVDVLAHLTGERPLAPLSAPPVDLARVRDDLDLANMSGQPLVRRALEIAAAGAHHLLFIGPPGCGKTTAARMLPTILPPLSPEEALEVTAVHSIAGLVRETGLVAGRPFRAPHHTVSTVGLVGGGDPVRPGEGDPSKRCECPNERVRAYRARLAATLLDRFDLQVVLRGASSAEASSPGEPSARVREHVVTAREVQADRLRRGEVAGDLDATARNLIERTVRTRGLSARRHGTTWRVARTIADLDGSRAVKNAHVEEAIQLTAALPDPRCAATVADLRRTHAPEAQGQRPRQKGHAPFRKSGNKELPE